MADTVTETIPEYVLFDMDNTLYDFYFAKKQSCEAVVDLAGSGEGTELFRYFLRGTHGFEDHNNIRDFLEDRSIFETRLYEDACAVYEEVKVQSLTLYPGVADTLRLLADAGVSMAIVTDAQSSQAEKRLAATGVRNYFEGVMTPDRSGVRKPKPDIFHAAAAILKCNVREAWIVGDSPKREIEPGNLLGMTTAYAKYGDWIGIPYPKITPDYTLESFGDLQDIMHLEK
ncbi:HAD family hydrolase [Methanogenium sp. MK-MG]|uniref:HAD family hydrolase n=1 Tax=Methanogenium sp. MK-MG TaxID=2599926 RepID=UPI0013ED4E48|nr:HAD family hydrolase [Methanogenium sp. MK-MG]KAF1074667.1 Phosphoglycolate phosphatase [Methanogenium sp. MK-MG]